MLRTILHARSPYILNWKQFRWSSSGNVSSTMRAWCVNEYGGDIEEMETMEVPHNLKPTEILVKIKAASLNPFDSLMRKGFGSTALDAMRKWNNVNTSPVILGRDFSGAVVKKGKMVTRFEENENIWGTPAVWKPGTFSEYCLVDQSEVAKKPDCLNDTQAASFPYAFCTLWSALCDIGGITARNAHNKNIFVVGGSGGIGTAAIQLIKAWGGSVTTTCSNDAIELVESLGADKVIDYNNEDVGEMIEKESRRFHVIIDTVGGNLDMFTKHRSCSSSVYILLTPPFLDNIDEHGIFVGTMKSGMEFVFPALSQRILNNLQYRWAYFKPSAAALNELKKLVDHGKIKPVIDSVYKFSGVPQAFEKLDKGHLRGKIVISME